MSYPVVPLSDIAEVKLGRQRSPKNHSGTLMRPYVRAANVSWSGFELEDVKTMNFSEKEMQTYRLRPGDVLLGEASGSASEVGKPAIWEGQIDNCAFQNTLIRVRPSDQADSRYLLHYFKHLAGTGKFARKSRGVGIYHLGRRALADTEVPLPSIEEQRRIAAVLDAADALRVKRREAIAKLDSLTQAIFIDMFGDPAANDHRWERARLGDHLDRIDSGRSPVCLDRPPKDGEWGVLKLGAVTKCVFDPTQAKALPDGEKADSRHQIRSGDLLFSRKNTRDLVAASALVTDHPNRLLLSDLIFRLVVRDETTVNPVFLHAQLIHPRVRRGIQRLAGGSAGSMPNISKSKLLTVPVCVPPISAQTQFAQRAQVALRRLQDAGDSADRLDNLFLSLQQRAFRGEL